MSRTTNLRWTPPGAREEAKEPVCDLLRGSGYGVRREAQAKEEKARQEAQAKEN